MKTSDKKSSFQAVRIFFPEVKAEIKKVTWATRKETIVTTCFVFVFSLIAAVYFLIVDQVIYKLLHWIIGFGSH